MRCVSLLGLLLVVCAAGAARADKGRDPLFLDHADSTELIRTDGTTEYHLYGNVHFSQGTTTLKSDQAVWRPDAGVIEFIGRVNIHQPGRRMLAERVVYQRDRRAFMAFGQVLVEDTTESFSLVAERARFYRFDDIAVADSLPVLRWDFMLDSAEQTIIRADTISFFRAEKRGLGEGSVRVHKGGWIATGARGEVWPDSGRAVLTGDPRAVGLGGDIRGDTLILIFSGRGVKRVTAIGHARGSYSDTSIAGGGRSILKGRRADFFLSGDTLQAIRVIGEAYTDHLSADSAGGTNHASGDSIWLRFDAGHLATLTVLGGAEGQYVQPRGASADTVDYRGALIRFVPDSGRIDLETAAQLRYGSVVLDANRISYWTDTGDLLARPAEEPDSAGELIEAPRLADGQQEVTGRSLTFNMNTRRGRIRGSSTAMQDGYYRGNDFRKYSDSIFFVSDGIYTTCDRPKPHFRFEGRDMLVIRDDKVIARPVVLRIGELPVAILPYYVFPIKKGRHSGFLPLNFGNFQRGERFIGNVGYYWAASDYWDLESALDFNVATGLRLRGIVNYAQRYKFSGRLSTSYARESRLTEAGQTKTTRWSIQGSHRQTLSPTASLSGTANFLSDKSYYQDYSYDPTDRRNRSLKSQLTFQKRFSGASISAVVSTTKNLDADSRRTQWPRASVSFSEKRLLSPDSGAEGRWYHNGYIGFSSSLNHFQSKDTTTGGEPWRYNEKRYLTVSHSGRVRFPQRIFQHITLSPNASFTETWYYVFQTNLSDSAGVLANEPARRASGSVGISSNTNLYGFLHPRLLGLTSIRHTLTPRIAYSFTPAVTRHDELRSYTGAGSGSSRRSQSLSVGISNTLDARLFEGENEKKVSLLNFNLSTRYDFEKDERRWSNLSGSARTSLAQRLDLTANATWDPYDTETLKLQWTRARLTNFGISAGMSLKGDASALSSVTALGGDPYRGDTLGADGRVPFNISLSYRYSESRGTAGTSKTHWMGWRVDFEPTANWSVRYQQTYNMGLKTVTEQTFEFNRDLHCWQARFLWIPGGGRKGYYFRIGVKKIPDIKIERSESGLLGGFGR